MMNTSTGTRSTLYLIVQGPRLADRRLLLMMGILNSATWNGQEWHK